MKAEAAVKQEEVASQPKARPSLERQKAFKQKKGMSIEAERPAKKAKQSSASSQCIILMPEVVEVEDEELKKVSRRKRFWVQQSWESQETKVSMGDGKSSKVKEQWYPWGAGENNQWKEWMERGCRTRCRTRSQGGGWSSSSSPCRTSGRGGGTGA